MGRMNEIDYGASDNLGLSFLEESDCVVSHADKPFRLVDKKKIDEQIIFLRVVITDMRDILSHVLSVISSRCWISQFDDSMIRKSYIRRLEATVNNLKTKIAQEEEDKITGVTGEKVVSELGREAVIMFLNYKDIPLGEVFKQAAAGNGGFDIFSENKRNEALFGEAKYIAGRNAYGSAFEQIVEFIEAGRIESDYVDIREFLSCEARVNLNKGVFGFIAAFSVGKTETDVLVKNIQQNADYAEICMHGSEVVMVAVNVNDE